jgi:predicted dehydrogenase
MKASVRVGVIGAGSWAISAHLPVLAARDDVELVGVCRPEADLAARIRDRFGFRMSATDYRDVLAEDLDAVVVASPAALHFEHAAAALEAGAHVLCEKPMTIDPAQAWRLVTMAEERGRGLLVSFGWNYTPLVRGMARLLEEHPIGAVEHLTIHMSSSTRELLTGAGAYPDAAAGDAPRSETWTDPALSGGGYAQAQLSHALALALGLFPDRVAAVASMVSPASARVELHDACALRMESGAIAVLSGGSAHAGAWGDRHDLQVRAIGSEGQAVLDLLRDLAWVYRPDEGESRLPVSGDDGRYDPSGPSRALVDYARGGGDNPAPGSLGARTVEALELLYRSAGRGGEVVER